MNQHKLDWQGVLIGIQPRIRFLRSFSERHHSYLGYSLRLRGTIGSTEGEFLVGIGKVAQAKQAFKIGDTIQGSSEPVADSRVEAVSYYKTAGLELVDRAQETETSSSPWHGTPPELPVYQERGHRRLASRTYDTKCTTCIWGCRMPVEMIIDQWNPRKKRYRFETFCYGPKSRTFYKSGPTRKVPGRNNMTWEEEDWVDEDATSNRSAPE